MNEIQEDHLTNTEKNLVAMGAAMGAGCRISADKLHGIALSLRIPEGDIAEAFRWGLDAKGEAVGTMQRKVATLIGDNPEKQAPILAGNAGAIASLARIAAFVAANSAPDALAEISQARAQGITAGQIQLCISLAKMVRRNAQAFSDQELAEHVCGIEPGEEASCCLPGPSARNAVACSCT